MNTKISDYYFDILQVNRHSSKDEIKKSFRILIKKWHPDKYETDTNDYNLATEKSKLLNEAYGILKNYVPIIQNKEDDFFKDNNHQDSKRERVNSSNIYSVGYSYETNTLQIEFKNRQVYEYYNVPVNIYIEFMNSQSKGKYATKYIYYKYKYQNISS